MIFPDLEIDLYNEKPLEKKTSNKSENNNIIHKQIEQEANICYKNNRKPMKIGMTEVEKARIEYENYLGYIKCNANSIGKYIRII